MYQESAQQRGDPSTLGGVTGRPHTAQHTERGTEERQTHIHTNTKNKNYIKHKHLRKKARTMGPFRENALPLHTLVTFENTLNVTANLLHQVTVR